MKRARDGDLRLNLDELVCPITHHLMLHPAVAVDGFSYERSAIRRWLLTTRMTSPMTNEPLESRVLRSNHALRKICEAALLALPASARAEAVEAAAAASVLDDAQLDRLYANINACAGMCLGRWCHAMDGDTPEEVARLLTASMRTTRRMAPGSAYKGLVAFERVAAVARTGAVMASASECALAWLSASGADDDETEAALRVIATAGGGHRHSEALAAVQRYMDRPCGLAALAELLPACDADQRQGCEQALVEALTGKSVVCSAMKPAAVLAMHSTCARVREAMAATMVRWHNNDEVQLCALRALREQADKQGERRGLQAVGFHLADQIMRTQVTGNRSVREAALALCSALGLLAVTPPPAKPHGEDDEEEEEDEEGDDYDESSSDAEEWDDDEPVA